MEVGKNKQYRLKFSIYPGTSHKFPICLKKTSIVQNGSNYIISYYLPSHWQLSSMVCLKKKSKDGLLRITLGRHFVSNSTPIVVS
jgi:hypothetical protein